MPRITLERRPGRDDLAAFGLAAGLLAAAAGALVATLVAPLAGPWAWLLPAAGLPPAAAARLSPWSLRRPYGWWNRAARGYGQLARAAVLGVTFGVFTAASRAGARFARSPAGPPGWTPKSAAGAPSAPGAAAYAVDAPWARRLLAWSRGPNRWAAVLVPFLLLLHALEAESGAKAAEEIYTLY